MEPNISYIICAAPRSGSHLLAEALTNTGIAGVPDEYFITTIDGIEGEVQFRSGYAAEKHGVMTLDGFRDHVIEIGSSDNGVFGITILWGDVANIIRNYREAENYRGLNEFEIFNKLFYNPKFIWLQRRDKVQQAVSYSKAIQTNVWRKSTTESFTPRKEPKFNFEQIDYSRIYLNDVDKGWRTFFDTYSIEPFMVVYEDFVYTYEETAKAILDFLAISYPAELDFSNRRLKKQADATSEAWVAEYTRIKRSPTARLNLHWQNIKNDFTWSNMKREMRKVSVRTWWKENFG